MASVVDFPSATNVELAKLTSSSFKCPSRATPINKNGLKINESQDDINNYLYYTSGVFVGASQRYHVESFRKTGSRCDGASFSAFQ